MSLPPVLAISFNREFSRVEILLEKRLPTSRAKFHNTIANGISRREMLLLLILWLYHLLSLSRSHENRASSRQWLRFSYIIRRASYPYRLQLHRMHIDWLRHIDPHIKERKRIKVGGGRERRGVIHSPKSRRFDMAGMHVPSFPSSPRQGNLISYRQRRDRRRPTLLTYRH